MMPQTYEVQYLNRTLDNSNYHLIVNQSDILNILENNIPSAETFDLAISTIKRYGFGVLLSLRHLYHAMTYQDIADFQDKTTMIQAMANHLMQPKGLDSNFLELRFLSISQKAKLRILRKKLNKDNSIIIWNVIKSSHQFVAYLINLKQQLRLLELITERDTHQKIESLFYRIRKILRQKPELNSFQKIHHTSLMVDFINQFHYLQGLGVSKRQQQLINNFLKEVKEDYNFLKDYGQATTIKKYYHNQNTSFQEIEESGVYTSSSEESMRNIKVIKVKYEEDYHRKIQAQNYHYKETNKEPIRTKESSKPSQTPSKALIQHSPSTKPLCCRTKFQQGEIILQAQSQRREYKNYSMPLDDLKFSTILKNITAFLNHEGGIIYLGIKEQNNRLRKVVGVCLNERQKEELLFEMRTLCCKVYPDIVLNKMYKIKFVPVFSRKGVYLPGRNVIKIIVEPGQSHEVYYCINNNKEGIRVCFRTENEVLTRQPNFELAKIFEFAKTKFQGLPREIVPDHEGSCPQPESGQPLYDSRQL